MSGVSDLDASDNEVEQTDDPADHVGKKARKHKRGGVKNKKKTKLGSVSVTWLNERSIRIIIFRLLLLTSFQSTPFETFASKSSATGAKFWKKKKQKPKPKHQSTVI